MVGSSGEAVIVYELEAQERGVVDEQQYDRVVAALITGTSERKIAVVEQIDERAVSLVRVHELDRLEAQTHRAIASFPNGLLLKEQVRELKFETLRELNLAIAKDAG